MCDKTAYAEIGRLSMVQIFWEENCQTEFQVFILNGTDFKNTKILTC